VGEEKLDWNVLVEDRNKWRVVVNREMNFRFL
jgi:hypothetical protein